MKIFKTLVPLTTKKVPAGKKEVKYYTIIKELFSISGWTALRLESKLQQGLPDFLCISSGKTLFAEVKVFRGNMSTDKLSFEDLTWQPGQIRFLTLIATNDIPYVLVVVSGEELTLYGNNAAKKCLLKS